MRNTFGVVVLSTLVGITGAAYAQTPDGEVPANENVCNGLKADGITKALYGLCVAFCEAQDCAATYDPATDEVTFDPNCHPSDPKILDIYNSRKSSGDPQMPCVNTIVSGCPCWTEAELEQFLDLPAYCPACPSGETSCAVISVWSTDPYRQVLYAHGFSSSTNSYADCMYSTETVQRYFGSLTSDQVNACIQSVRAECHERGAN